MFAGSFLEMNFFEVAQLLAASHQSGVLILSSADDSQLLGSVYFKEGQLAHAAADKLSGLDAINLVCGLQDAKFHFETGIEAPEHTLISYPQDRVLEKIKTKVESLGVFLSSIPAADQIPVYQPGKSIEGIQASPDELSVLLRCKGNLNISDIASLMGLDEEQLCRILGKFHQAGMVVMKQGRGAEESRFSGNPPGDQSTLHPPASPAIGEDKPVRYWRGKRVQ